MTPRPTVRPWFLWFLAIAVPVLAFMPSIAGGWIYDDNPLIAKNAYVQSFAWAPRWFTHDFWNVQDDSIQFGMRMIYWRPAVNATYALDWKLSGGAPIWFHLTNIAGHAAVAALSFHVLRRWLDGAVFAALAAALLFAVHPTKAESVAWIAGRTDVICMFALLLASTGIARRLRGQRYGLLLEVVGTLLAYLSKEQAIVLPAFVVIELWVFADRPAVDLPFVKRALRAAAPQLALAACYLIARTALLPLRADEVSNPPPLHHLLSILETLGHYISLTFAPHDLSIQQGLIYTVNGEMQHSVLHIVLGTIGVAAMLGVALACRRRLPGVTLGVGFYLVTLMPTSNLVYTGMKTLVSERFLYLPFLGVALAAGSVLVRLRGRARAIATGLALLLAVLACVVSMRRSADYGDEDRFWARERAMHPTSSEASTHFVNRAIRDKRTEAALHEVLAFQRAFTDRDTPMETRVDAAVTVAYVTAMLTPDLDTASLRAIDGFVAAMLAADRPSAVLEVRGVRMEISPTGKAYEHVIAQARPRLLALRTDLAGRLGDVASVNAAIEAARHACATCTAVVKSEALALARIGKFDDALASFDRIAQHIAAAGLSEVREHILEARARNDMSLNATGPAAIRAHALMYSALEAWGAAYQVMAPHKADIAHVRDVALGFAELAYRAGASEVAKEVLALHLAPTEIQPLLDDWAAKMGWRR